MMPCYLRSLLLAAIVLSNCITWTASRHHYTHNVSRHRSRHRRQGTGLYLSASYVIPEGEGTGWGEWGEVSACSRTCGGGVASQKRICLEISPDGQQQCTGGDTKYFSCETQDCPAGGDFRAEQCAEYNNVSFRGINYKWVPYTKALNPCELNCMPHGERFYYRHKAKVLDGTRCNDESFDVCVNGTCQPVGCDMMLGSNAREDKCRLCRGNGVNCHTMHGLLDTQDIRKGYNDMLLIPQGATNIVIMEVKPSNNYLALRAKNGTYYLNGDYHIDFPRSLIIADAPWYYERSQQGFAAPDKLRCLGPTNEPLYLSLLLQDENVGIEYEYSLPTELAPPPTQRYNWVHENFTPCTATCGGGFQTRNVTCRSREELDIVDEGLCDEGLKPPTNQTCNTQACPAQWVEGPWSRCSKRCGKGGTMSREVRCEKIITNGFPSIVADKECFDLLGPKPELYQECNLNATCPTWYTGPWKNCDKLCGEGKQTRQVVCYQKNGRRIDVLEDDECVVEKPGTEQPCQLQPCDGVDWVLTDWAGCDTCLSVNRTRVAECATKDYQVLNASFCSYHPTPVLTEPCDRTRLPPCQVQWYATQWSKCSVECGKGVQTRRVFCGLFDGVSVVKVDDDRCGNETKYNDTKPCVVPKELCPSKWYAGPWSECTVKCGGGEQYRKVMCLRGGKEATDCDVVAVLDATQTCNTGPCNEDEILPISSSSAPIMDDYEDCVDDEDYPEVGLDAETTATGFSSSIDDLMFRDSPSSDEGSGESILDFGEWKSTSSGDTGSGSEITLLSDELLAVDTTSSDSADTFFTDSLETTESYTTDTTKANANETTVTVETDTTNYDSTGTDPTIDDYDSTLGSSTGTEVTEQTILAKTRATEESKPIVRTTDPSPTDATEDTYKSEPTESTLTENLSEIAQTESTLTEETYESEPTESTITTETAESTKPTLTEETSESDSTEITSESGPTDSTLTGETSESGTTKSTVTEETIGSESTQESTASKTSKSAPTADSSVTEMSGSTDISTTESNGTSDSGSIDIEATKKTTEHSTDTTDAGSTEPSGFIEITTQTEPESTLTEETYESEPTESTITTDIVESTKQTLTAETSELGPTEKTSESGPTESTLTEETSESKPTESTSPTETEESAKPTLTEETSESSTTETKTTKKTSESGPTEETSESDPTESTLTEETDESKPTESTITTDIAESSKPTLTAETSESGPTEKTSESGPTESRVTEETSESKPTESTSPTDIAESTKSTLTEETSESGPTESTLTGKTLESSSTENTSESGPTESTLTEETYESEPTEATITSETIQSTKPTLTEETSGSGRTEFTLTGKTSESITTISTVTEETTETGSTQELTARETSKSAPTVDSSVTEISGSTDVSTTESTKKITENGTETTEAGPTVTSGSIEITTQTEALSSVSAEEPESSTTATEKTTESVSTVAESDYTQSSSSSSSTEIYIEDFISTTEGSTTESELSTTESGATETSTKSSESNVTETGSEGSMEFSSTVATETTELISTESTAESTSEHVTSSSLATTEGNVSSIGTTSWDWKTTLGVQTTKRHCRKRKPNCAKTRFGCCPDRRTPSAGPFDEGCPKPKTCKESMFGCCPDAVSPALGPNDEGCPITPCLDTLFGCCLSDNKTAAEGNDQEGCPPMPPACKSTPYGCCEDGETEANGPEGEGCLEYTTMTSTESATKSETESVPVTETTGTKVQVTVTEVAVCASSTFGCCYDNETEAIGPDGLGCPCNTTEFGCCSDGVSPAQGAELEGCCNITKHGCCPDGKNPAHGPGHEGCCLLYAFGCCPDNYMPANGPHLEGCGCQQARFGCCPDNVTYAHGPHNEGCGCQYTAQGCCPDRQTEASGPNFEGCGCHTFQFGCCPDGVTIAKGPSLQGCHCRQSKYGCCGDGETAASGTDMQGCDCSSSKYGCCPDGHTAATGPKFLGCTDVPENKQAACSLPTDRGSCRNYSVYWYYDLEYGGCSRFWYGGCDGNGNRFNTKEECEDVCVQPSPKDACKLPKVKGACNGYHVRWYYDDSREQCSQFSFGGCLGNANNFDTRELCQTQCEPARTADQCSLSIERGSCAGNFARWGFNAEMRRCEEFIWGGCEGNANRFSSEAACLQRCNPPGSLKPQCTQLQEVGNCTDKEALWAFSQSENRCVPFYYTGCGGNENRFDTEESCAQTCPSAFVPDTCTLPADAGECANYREKWYYDTTDQRCRQFYYGGCGGNSNNFASQMECEVRCSELKVTTTVQPPPPESPTSEFCFLEQDPGPCTQMQTRWAYDYTVGRCTTFEYGGCGGNRNNFPNEEYCQYYCKPTQDICQLPMLSGPCDESLMRWFYDPATDACSQFTYGGCEGNDNRFETREGCERRCRTGPATEVVVTPAPAPSTVVVDSRFKEDVPEECRISPSLEECNRSGVVWYLDSTRRECVSHENLDAGATCRTTGVFTSQEACERSCGAFKNIDVCQYPLDPGSCRNFVSKYYFEAASGRCHEFAYGGCHGGPNRFSTIDECMQVCKPEIDPCKQGPEPGSCLARFVLWYYDEPSDSCVQFVYGGCGGNDNRFETREDCEGRCRRQPTSIDTTTVSTTTTTAHTTTTGQAIAEECRTPDSLAPCGANVTVYYYDSATSRCVESDIGGCRYSNSYRTEEECERRCGAFVGINVCESRLEPGPCRASIPKFYWDAASGSCQSYAYGGCGGSANRFSSVDECEEVCGATGPAAACLQAVATGSAQCGAPSRRWHYSVPHADCLVFAYQGCAGNDNNFKSYSECAVLCKVSQTPETNEVLPDCSRFEDECNRLKCPAGVERARSADGCDRCTCAEAVADCAPARLQCEALRCKYGVKRTTAEDGCERCECYEDPCARARCPAGTRCAAAAARDAATHEPRYTAHCAPEIDTNEVLPDCDRLNEECSRLVCEHGVRRTRVGGGCERCECARVAADCAPLRLACDALNCTHGIDRVTGDDGCERCSCTDPCSNKECPAGERCVATPYWYPVTQEYRYSTECRPVNKMGACPVEEHSEAEEPCRQECQDDAECRGVGKCCARGCSRLCLPPAPLTTTLAPDLLSAPVPSRETEPEVTAAEGGVATLRCIFHGNPPPKITWRRGEITIDGNVGRYRLLSDGALEIVSLYRNDTGVYICIADNGLGKAQQEVRLQVNDPVKTPVGIAGDQKAVLTGELGRPLAIRCLAYGFPQPSVFWYRGLNGPMVPYSSSLYEARGNVLLIRRLTHKTLGEYACHAYNGEGRAASWLVVVQAYQTDGTPLEKYIVPRARPQRNETIRVRVVDVTHRAPLTEPTTTTTTMTPAPVSNFVEPAFTDLPAAPVTSRETEPEVSAAEGGVATLRCIFHGNPPPKISWRRGEITIDGNVGRYRLLSDGALEIVSLYRNDTGVYICIADNGLGKAQQEVRLQVNDPVKTPVGIAGDQNAVLTGELGRPLAIRCLAYGFPQPSVFWYRGLNGPMVPYSSSLYEARGNVLLIRRLTYETLGEYACQAYNGEGRAVSWLVVVQAYQTDDTPLEKYIVPRVQAQRKETIRVRVVDVTQRAPLTEPTTTTTTTTTTPEPEPEFENPIFTVPVSTRISAPYTSLVAGSELSLPCEVDGYPEPDVYWTKDNVRLVSGDNVWITGTSISRLTIARVAVNDSGVYGCHASNPYSSHFSSVEISVQGLTIPAKCTDNPFFANCHLIVRSKFCRHKYYSKFCCKSCMEAGQLSPEEVEMQADQPLTRKK